MVLGQREPKTLQIQWFWNIQDQMPYKYNGFGTKEAQNVINTMVFAHSGPNTL